MTVATGALASPARGARMTFRRVVVHPEDVDRRGARVELADVDAVEDRPVRLHDVARVAAAHHRVEEPAVRGPVMEPVAASRSASVSVAGSTWWRFSAMPIARLRRPAARIASTAARCARWVWCAARSAADQSWIPGACRPMPWPSIAMHHGSLSVSQFRTRSPNRSAEDRGVLGEAGDDLAVRPAAGILERLRQVPVEQRQPRLDPPLEQPVDEPIVEVEALRVRRAAAGGLDPRPRDAEPIGAAGPSRGHQVEVLRPVGGSGRRRRRRCRRPRSCPGVCAVRVPDARPASVGVDGALDLVRGGGGTPGEARGNAIDAAAAAATDGRGGPIGRGLRGSPEPAIATSARGVAPASLAVIAHAVAAGEPGVDGVERRAVGRGRRPRAGPRPARPRWRWSTQTPSST